MSGSVAAEAPRGRPLSGGLWSLLGWLRRDDSSSQSSLSSAGSDRTAASFAFLAPTLYPAAPARLLAPRDPSDSYKRRVRDSHLRRRRDADLTLHRKYGLYGLGYEVQSLPSAGRRTADEPRARASRAASESPREHVPGKRRAPPPPARADTVARSTRRKRPAPPPPAPLAPLDERHADDERPDTVHRGSMNREARPAPDRDAGPADASGCKPEKCSKRDSRAKETRDVKLRTEKSFLKQIFDGRKRNSAVDTASVKLLPNISELDKQAAEMIEKYRLKEMARDHAAGIEDGNRELGASSRQMEAWICTICLRKYNATVITCNYCLPLNKGDEFRGSSKVTGSTNHGTQTNSVPGSSKGKAEDKEKLKEMLKEMKDSLPKRPKSYNISSSETKTTGANDHYPKVVEAATLRIGSSISKEEMDPAVQAIDSQRRDNTASSSQVPEPNNTSKLASQNRLGESKERNNVIAVSVSGNCSNQGPSVSNNPVSIERKKELTTIQSVLITQPVVLEHTREDNVVVNTPTVKIEDLVKLNQNNNCTKDTINHENKHINQGLKTNETIESKASKTEIKSSHDLNTPMKISSLLNPIYIPKSTTAVNKQTSAQQTDNVKQKTTNNISKTQILQETKTAGPSVLVMSASTSNSPIKESTKINEAKNVENVVPTTSTTKINTVVKEEQADKKIMTVLAAPKDNGELDKTKVKEISSNQHTRRRELINQLERSIAIGDEKAAADAAVKLAQLRLACSVLSFSSQIVAGASTSATTPQTSSLTPVNESRGKVDEKVQKSAETKIEQTGVKETKDPNVISTNVATNFTKIEHDKVLPTSEVSSNKLNDDKANKNEQSVKCEASTSKGINKNENDYENCPILVWVEDKEATRGPVQLHVRRDAVMGDLRKQAERSLGLAAAMQRWIVGRSLCTDDNTLLVTLAGADLTAPFYLCLVESETKESSTPKLDEKLNDKDAGNVYNELMRLERQAIVSNTEAFECGVCMEECGPGSGVVLRECVHSFCKECVSDVVRHSEDAVVACPAIGCRGVLQEREIRGLVSPEDYEKWLARGLAAAESGTRHAFHCRTRDCTGWALCEPGVRRFPCPVCKRTNCVPCQAIHEKQTCEQHRAKLQRNAASNNSDVSNNGTDEGTKALLDTLISRGEALECPECRAIITKKWGCDWVKCSACKTEICWVTKGRRWGPAGRGDTSAGCRCGVDGKRCHPSCGYCH